MKKYMKKITMTFILVISIALSSIAQMIIQLEKKNGVYYLPCKVNGMSLEMIFDTGASVVTISLNEAKRMVENGTLDRGDVLSPSYLQTASGDVIVGTYILLKRLEIGNLILKNVKANVVNSLDAPLLLGQSVIGMLGKVSLNLSNNTLEIIPNAGLSDGSVKEFDVEKAQPMNGLFRYSTNLKEGMYNIPIFGIYNGDWEIVYRIPRYVDIHVIDNSNTFFAKVNVNGHVGYVLKTCLNSIY